MYQKLISWSVYSIFLNIKEANSADNVYFPYVLILGHILLISSPETITITSLEFVLSVFLILGIHTYPL